MSENDQFREHTRRGFLQGIGTTTIGVATAAEGVDGSGATAVNDGTILNVGEHAWRMFKADARNTGYHPTASGPTDEPTERWCFETNAVSVSSPAVVNDTAYVGTDEGAVYALDVASGDPRDGWPFTTDGSVRSIPTVVDGTLYVGSGETIYALTADAGEEQWCFETDGQGGSITGSLTVVDGTVYVGSTGGNIYALDAASGALRDGWPHSGGNPKSSTPVVADGMVYVTLDTPDGPELRALNTDGTVEWVFPFPVRDTETTGITVLEPTSPAVAGGSVYFGSKNKSLYAVDAATGERQWGLRGRKPIQSSPAVADGTVYAGFDNWFLYAVDAASGEEVWRHELDDAPVRTAPAVVDGTLYVSTVDRTVYAFDPETPEERWRVELDVADAGVRSPTVVDGTVYVGTNDGMMCALDGEGGDQSTDTGEPEAVLNLDPTDPVVGQTVTFDASESTAPGGSITSYEWDLDGDGEFEKEGEHVTYTFDEAGEYEVRLTVVDNQDASAKTTQTVSVMEPSEKPSLTLTTVRPVQTVEYSHVRRPDGTKNVAVPAVPDIVANRPTSVLFNFEGQRVDALDNDETITLTVSTDTGTQKKADLRGKRIKELSYSPDEHPGSVEEEKIFATAPRSERPPVFNLDPKTSRIYVRLGLTDDNVRGDQVELEAGTDFGMTESRTLHVGFIEVRAPETPSGPTKYAYGRRNEDGMLDTEYNLPGGDVSREVEWPREMFNVVVDECQRYIERVYPVESVEVFRHPGRIQGVTKGFTSYSTDMTASYNKLVAEFEDLDATVAIVPGNYHSYHEPGGNKDQTGYHSGAVHMAASVEVPDMSRNIGDIASTAAHEIGHHLLGENVYPKWAAQRRDPNDDGTVDQIDRSHARTELHYNKGTLLDEVGLRSIAFDLFGDSFSVLREGANRGYWARGRTSDEDGGDQWTLGSFMSYGFDDLWADALAYQQMIDNDLSPPSLGFKLPDADDIPVLSGLASVNDHGGIEELRMTTRLGRPMSDTSEGNVTLDVTAPDGSSIETVHTTDSLKIFDRSGENRVIDGIVTFVLPFPDETAEIVITHEEHGTETTVNPIEMTLRSAIQTIPDEGFTTNPSDRRQALLDTVASVKSAMDNGNYEAVVETIEDLRSDVRQWVKAEYDAAANQPTRDELLALIDGMRSRVVHLKQESSGSGFGLPHWLPWAGGAGALGLGAGAYRYLKGRETAGHSGEGDDE